MGRDERLCFGKRSIKDHGNQHLASFENRLASGLHLMQDGEDLVLRCQGLPEKDDDARKRSTEWTLRARNAVAKSHL
jgi:hypothetical protein